MTFISTQFLLFFSSFAPPAIFVPSLRPARNIWQPALRYADFFGELCCFGTTLPFKLLTSLYSLDIHAMFSVTYLAIFVKVDNNLKTPFYCTTFINKTYIRVLDFLQYNYYRDSNTDLMIYKSHSYSQTVIGKFRIPQKYIPTKLTIIAFIVLYKTIM
jgi:hypothetical protein